MLELEDVTPTKDLTAGPAVISREDIAAVIVQVRWLDERLKSLRSVVFRYPLSLSISGCPLPVGSLQQDRHDTVLTTHRPDLCTQTIISMPWDTSRAILIKAGSGKVALPVDKKGEPLEDNAKTWAIGSTHIEALFPEGIAA